MNQGFFNVSHYKLYDDTAGKDYIKAHHIKYINP